MVQLRELEIYRFAKGLDGYPKLSHEEIQKRLGGRSVKSIKQRLAEIEAKVKEREERLKAKCSPSTTCPRPEKS